MLKSKNSCAHPVTAIRFWDFFFYFCPSVFSTVNPVHSNAFMGRTNSISTYKMYKIRLEGVAFYSYNHLGFRLPNKECRIYMECAKYIQGYVPDVPVISYICRNYCRGWFHPLLTHCNTYKWNYNKNNKLIMYNMKN